MRGVAAGVPEPTIRTACGLADIIFSAAEPAGWVFIAEPTDKERRYCKKIGLEIVDADIFDLIGEPQPA